MTFMNRLDWEPFRYPRVVEANFDVEHTEVVKKGIIYTERSLPGLKPGVLCLVSGRTAVILDASDGRKFVVGSISIAEFCERYGFTLRNGFLYKLPHTFREAVELSEEIKPEDRERWLAACDEEGV